MKIPLFDLRHLSPGYSSENVRKYTSRNPLARWAPHGFLLKVGEIVERRGPQTILDVGCGEGLIGDYLRQRRGDRAYRYVGANRSWQALQVAARLNPGADFFCMEITSLGFKGASFELVLCLEVLEHIPDPAVAQLGNHPEHLHPWGPRRFRAFLSRSFHVRELHNAFPWLLAVCEQ